MAFIEFKTKRFGSVYIASWGKTNAGAILLLALPDGLKLGLPYGQYFTGLAGILLLI